MTSSCQGKPAGTGSSGLTDSAPVPISLICLGLPVSLLGLQMGKVWASASDSCLKWQILFAELMVVVDVEGVGGLDKIELSD